jgi:hypothetical protein
MLINKGLFTVILLILRHILYRQPPTITYVISMVGCTAMLDMFDLFDYGWIDTSTLLLGAVRLWKIKVT